MSRPIRPAAVVLALAVCSSCSFAEEAMSRVNLAVAAQSSTSFVSGHETITALNNDIDPHDSNDRRNGVYGNWPEKHEQWVEYEWSKPIKTNAVDVYWFQDARGIRVPTSSSLQYWNGTAYVDVPNAKGLGVEVDRYNTTSFDTVTTTKLRLKMVGRDEFSTGILEWKVYDAGGSPDFPPEVRADIDRVVVLPQKTHLSGSARGIKRQGDVPTFTWVKQSGPGEVVFDDASAPTTEASFTVPGDYVIALQYALRDAKASGSVNVRVENSPQAASNLVDVPTTHYAITSPLWKARAKSLIVNWIPHCIAKNEEPDLKEGGLNNYLEAGKKLAGQPYKKHIGYPFSNAWVLNTVEAICVALNVDPQGDPEIIKAQDDMRATLEKWIPILLAAQEPEGFLQTRYTLGTERDGDRKFERFDPRLRGEHEGYVEGYFIEAAIAHHQVTGGKDARLFDAALKCADAWCARIGPGKKEWYDGHQEMELALVRLGRYVNETQGVGKGQKYIDLSKFLMDCRGKSGGEEYDQSHAPIARQYAAVGHAVRASYNLRGIVDIAMETRDPGYWTAAQSIWDNLIHRKLYVTGGIGSGETSEGFGNDYSLGNNAYCESCSGSGVLFVQHGLNLATHDARYADLAEVTLYNALLGDTDLDGKNFTYTNALDSDEARYGWHVCPCCVGNIPRTLLALPTWMYAKGDDAIYVNQYLGSKVNVGTVAGTDVELVQSTDYPWKGEVAITVNPNSPATFALKVRVPTRDVSGLYKGLPTADGLTAMSVNGEPVALSTKDGYVTVNRRWKAGDVLAFSMPLVPQQVTASDKIAADRGKVALRYGPLVYNLESVDGPLDKPIRKDAELKAVWRPELLGGVMTLTGTFADGSPLVAIPNYARLNRGGRSIVWMKAE